MIENDFLKKIIKIFCDNKFILLICTIITCINFFYLLTKNIIMIDEEFFQTFDSNPNIFLHLSRWTNFIYAKIFFNGKIFYFWTDFIAIILFVISAFLFLFPFYKNINNFLIKILSISIFSTIPFCVGQNFAFSEQIIPISISMCLTAISFLLTINDNKKISLILSIIFLSISIGSYQAFICIFFTSITAYCLYKIIFDEKCFYILKKSILVLCLSVMLYMIIDFIFSNFYIKTNYLLNNYTGFISKNQFVLLFLSILNVIRVNFGITVYDEVIFGGFLIRIIYILFIIILFYKFRHSDKKNILKIIFYYLLFFISPYILYIMLFTYKTQGRMLLSLSITCSVQIIIIYKLLNKKIYKKFFVSICFGFLIYNLILNNLSFKNAYDVYKNDTKTIETFKKYFNEKNIITQNKKLIVIGKIENKISNKFKNVTIGASFFEWDDGNINRIRELFSLNDIVFLMPNKTDLETALELSKNMPNWDDNGSIIDYKNLLIIKLSEPSEKWYINNLDILNN